MFSFAHKFKIIITCFILFLGIIFPFSVSLADEESTAIIQASDGNKAKSQVPPPTGNFMLPQQISPLISLGQNIVDQGVTQLQLYGDYLNGYNLDANDMLVQVVYGLRDDLAFVFQLPYRTTTLENSLNQFMHSAGFGDTNVQLEYAYYNNTTAQFIESATVLGAIGLPTGSSATHPPTGYGAPSYLAGVTYNRFYVKWFGFVSGGFLYPAAHNGTKFGNNLLYQCGIGRNILSVDSRWSLAWLIEGDGIYSGKDQFNGKTDYNSGGNVVTVTPSLSLLTRQLLYQLGVGIPVIQHLNGQQNEANYYIAGVITWTI